MTFSVPFPAGAPTPGHQTGFNFSSNKCSPSYTWLHFLAVTGDSGRGPRQHHQPAMRHARSPNKESRPVGSSRATTMQGTIHTRWKWLGPHSVVIFERPHRIHTAQSQHNSNENDFAMPEHTSKFLRSCLYSKGHPP
jgi:hypothetical protein